MSWNCKQGLETEIRTLKNRQKLGIIFFGKKKKEYLNQSFQALLPGLSSRLLEENEASRTDPGLR